MIKYLIPVDGSAQSMHAAYHAMRLVSSGLKARFVVANVQEAPNLYELVVAHDPDVLHEVSDAAGHDLIRAAVALLASANQLVEEVVVSGDPAHALLELVESHACDAVIMSAHGGGESERGLGSVAQHVVQHCAVPVTIVRPAHLEAPDAP
ncbi:MAG: universal stress protein [Hydrogenophaga sp.]|uniref:universal stress protein n=1 Tax=Hydrogenophaga sp. TaxID=1904254 RepID=UPI002ABC606C|nr:universal stress protein [Hydrogenophaga sp.]MDZ4100245.1 universal stress protein [Hydrogenophaga sp.]